ncbi:ankyrin repeat domain-containing protein 17-like isoform X3 [Branchiostoma lanceolatum]|uniref:ankyrin repeat domain-containing protein 17-like isoform X3 n=1 Tax=Branchiostoma lanceolatum TaxID=7740 RepID=UPI0034545F0F
MQHDIQNVEGEPEQMAKNEGNSGSKVEPLNVTFTKLADPHAVLAAAMQDDLMADLSGSEEGEVSEVESFILDPEDLEGHPMLDTASKLLLTAASEGADLRAVDPETQARLEALLEAAADGKAFADPEVLRRLTSSVSCALDEAAAALTRMRAENGGGSNNSQDGDGSLAEACNEGDVAAVRRLLDEGRSVHETNEEGESLLSLACSAGYYELAQVLLAMHANVEDRGLKGDCTPLMEAASGGYTDIVKLLIAHGADVNSRSSTGNTALTYACAGGYEDVVRILLEAGARIEDHNENGHTPLMEASSAGHVGVARLLLERGAGINTHSNEFKESALTLACYKGHLDMVRFLLEAGADQEHKTDEMHTALMEASMDGHVEVARLLLDHGAQVNMPTDSFESPLTLAACGGHVELANLLIERGANLEEVNDEGYTPLMEAAREGHEEMVALLLSQGANINAQTEETQETALTLACCGGFLEVSDFLIKAGADMELGCSTPLMEAAQEGHLELVKYLIQAGASIHAQTATGDTALTYACENGHTDVADILLQAGAELEHESEGGRTPLMKAARAGHLCTVQFLITRGADVNRATSNNDHTVLSLACAGGHISVVELLLAHGADPSHKLKDGSTMLIESAKGGHATVASLLMDYPNNMLTPPPPPEVPQLASPTSENGQMFTQDFTLLPFVSVVSSPNFQAPRVPTQALPTVVPPQEPDQRPGQLTSTDITGGVSQAVPAGDGSVSTQLACSTGVDYDQLQKLTELELRIKEAIEKNAQLQAEELDTQIDPNDPAAKERMAELNRQREEQLKKKQRILEELQKVERELQEKAAQQLQNEILALQNQASTQSGTQTQMPSAAQPQGSEVCSAAPSQQGAPVASTSFPLPTQPLTFLPTSLTQQPLPIPSSQQQIYVPTVPGQATAFVPISPQSFFLPTSQNQGSFPVNSQPLPVVASGEPAANTAIQPVASNCIHQDAADTVGQAGRSAGHQAVLLPAPVSSTQPNQPLLATMLQKVEGQSHAASPNNQSVVPSPRKDPDGAASVPQATGTPAPAYLPSMMPGMTDFTPISPPLTPATLPVLPTPLSMVPLQGMEGLTFSQTMAGLPVVSQSMMGAMLTNQNFQGVPMVTQALPLPGSSLVGEAADGSVSAVPVPTPDRAMVHSTTDPSQLPAIYSSPQMHTVGTQCVTSSPGSQPSSVPLTPNPSPVPAPSLPIYPGIEVDAQTESNHDTALTLACAGGHEDLVRELMARAANLEHRDKKGFTPLILAATAGHSSVVEVLLDHGADIEAQSERTKDTPLSLACSGGRQEVVELLLARGANKEHRNVSDYTPLSLAASGGYVNIIKLLLQHGAEINSRTGSKLGISPLMLAAMNGHTQAVKLLLDMGSDINAQIETNRNTALTLACFQGRHEVVSLLVDRKANVEHRAKTGLTPLMEAASGGYAEVGRVLLDKGADVNAAPVPSSRDTALTIAADKGHYKFCELLIQRGAQIDVRNKKGNTPLWLAANGGHLDVVQLLVSAGADKDAEDNRKITPLMATFRKGHVKVVRWLVKEVTQFPSDQECMRYIATISDKELLKKCHQSMEIIVSAKDRQAAEANKNASILLEELDMEKTREEKKKEAAARRREKKRQKRKEKQQAKEKEQQDESPENKKEEEEVEEEPVPLDPPAASTTTTIGKVRTTDTVSTVASRNTKNVAKTTMANAAPPKMKDRPSKRESKKKSKGREDSNTAGNNSSEDQKKNKKDAKQEKKSSAGELDDFDEAIKPKRSKGNLITRDAEDVVKVIKTTALASESHSGLSPVTLPHGMMKSSIATTSTVTTISVKPSATVAISPKRGSKKEEGWKEVIPKKSKRMLVPGSAVSRVIGRGGCNINAIREVSGAHIELDKQKTASGDRWITIKGNNDGMRQAQNLLNALIKEPDRELAEIIPRVKPKVASKTSPSTSPPSNKPAAGKPSATKAVPTTVMGRVPMTAVSVVTGKPPVMAQSGTVVTAQKQIATSGSTKTQRSLSNPPTSSIPLYSNPTQSVLNQIQSQSLRHPGIQAAMTQLPPPFPHPQAAPSGWGPFPVRAAAQAVIAQGQKGQSSVQHHMQGTSAVVTAATTTTTTASTTTAHAVSSSTASGVPQPPNVESARRQLFSEGNMPPPAMRGRSDQLSRSSATYTTQVAPAGTNSTFADKVGPPGARLQTSQAQPMLHAARPGHVTHPSEVKSTVTMVTSGLPSSGGSVGLIGPPGRRENPPMSMAQGVGSASHVGSPHGIPPQMSASVPQSAPPDYSAPAYSPFSGNSPFGQVGQPRSMFTVSSRPKSMGDIPNLLFPNSYTSDQSQAEGMNGSVAPGGYRGGVVNHQGHYPNSSPPNYTTSPMAAPTGSDIFTPLPAHNSTRSSTPSTAASSESPIPPQSPRSSPIGSSASPSPTPIGADKPGQERKPKPIGTERAHKKAGSSAMLGEMSHPLGPSNIWSYPITGATLELLRTLRDASSPWVAPSHLLNAGGLPDNYPPHPDNIRPHMSPPTSMPAPPLGPYPMGDKPPMGMSNPSAGRMPPLYGQAMQQYPHLGHPPVHPPSTHSSYPPTGPPPLPPDVMWNHTHGKLPPHAEEPRNQNQGWGMWNQQ